MNKRSSVIPAKAGIHASFLFLLSLLFLALTLACPVSAVAPLDLLAASAGARAQALGQAGVALDQGVFAPFWNPAALDLTPPATVALDEVGLAQPKPGLNFRVGSHYAKLYGEVDRFVLAAGLPWGNFSFDLIYASEAVGDIPLVSEDLNGRPVLEGSFSDNQTVLAGTVSSTVINEKFRVGGTVKMAKHSLYQQSVTGFGLDLGAAYEFNEFITFGAAVRNVLPPKYSWSSGYGESFARKIEAGCASRLVLAGRPVNLLAQLGYEQGSGMDYGLGGEVFLVDWLPVRLGLDKQSLTAGLGLAIGQFGLDYAYRGNADLGAAHQVSLEVKF